MPVSALVLALAAALLHAGWNVLLARARDIEAATAVALLVALAAFAPFAAATWRFDREAVPYVVASAALELAYFVLLATAYRRADLSVVYPLARGLAPVIVLTVGLAALGAESNAAQAVAVVLVAAGVLLIRGPARSADPRATTFGLAIAGTVAAYTLVDDRGMEHAAPLPYLVLVLAVPALVYAAAIGTLRGVAALRAEIRPASAVAGAAMLGAFALALAALARAPAAPVAAIRETSVVFATVLAAVVLREPVTRGRLGGAALVAAGIAVLSAAG